jgi:hypothetical protein
MGCPVEQELLDQLIAASWELSEAIRALATAPKETAQDYYKSLNRRVKSARLSVEEARRTLTTHRLEHKC